MKVPRPEEIKEVGTVILLSKKEEVRQILQILDNIGWKWDGSGKQAAESQTVENTRVGLAGATKDYFIHLTQSGLLRGKATSHYPATIVLKASDILKEKSMSIKVNEAIIKKLGLCHWPSWCPEEIDLCKFYLVTMLDDRNRANAIEDIKSFLDAVHKKFPSLAKSMCDRIWRDHLKNELTLEGVFVAYLILGDDKDFFVDLNAAINKHKEAREFFKNEPPFKSGDIVVDRHNEYYYVRSTLVDTCQLSLLVNGKPDTNSFGSHYSNFKLVYRSK